MIGHELTAKVQSRRVTGFERMWHAADQMAPPFVNQMVLEGVGRLPDRDWDTLAVQITGAQPAWGARLHGHLWFTRWTAGGPPLPIRRVDGKAWDGLGPEGAPFLQRRLRPRLGPVAEILLVDGDPFRVVLRTHHALADGGGTLLLARAFFALLRGEAPPEAELGPTTEEDIARSLNVPPEQVPPRDSASICGPARKAPFGVTWRRSNLPGSWSGLLPRVAVALARRVPPCASSCVRMDVPVDLRRHHPASSSSANLTGMIRLPMHELLKAPDPVAATRAHLRQALNAHEEASMVLALSPSVRVPLGAMIVWGAIEAKRALAQGRYGSTAVLSNLGRFELEAFSCPEFQAQRVFFIPPGQPGLPLFLALSGSSSGLDLCATMPLGLAHHLDELLEGVKADLLEDACTT